MDPLPSTNARGPNSCGRDLAILPLITTSAMTFSGRSAAHQARGHERWWRADRPVRDNVAAAWLEEQADRLMGGSADDDA
jgi:hypothetical protein